MFILQKFCVKISFPKSFFKKAHLKKRSFSTLKMTRYEIELEFKRKMASFFYYESYIGLLVKWKRHNEGLILKSLKYIILSSFLYILIIWCERYIFVFNFVLNWFKRSIFYIFLQKSEKSIYIFIYSCIYLFLL